MILEPFGGPGGSSTGLALLGRHDAVGVELNPDACRTAVVAGHRRVRADVATFPLDHLAGQVEGLVMSPPCQAFSRAGKRLGLKDQPGLYAHLRLVTRAGRWVDYDPQDWHDPRSPLVLQVVRWIDALRPEWVACEQVPDVIPLWQAVARWMHGLGYGTAVGLLSAERFGVPQTRQRAFLVGRLGGSPHLPGATHQAYEPGRSARAQEPDLWGPGLLPWVSMAGALGWSADRPARTVCGDQPAPTLVANARSWELRTNQVPGGADGGYQRRPADEPAPTVSGQGRSWGWELLPSGREKVNDRTLPRPLDAPSMTVAFGHSDMRWSYRNGNQDHTAVRDQDQPAPTVHFGARMNQVDWVADRQYDEQTVRVEVWQAGVLQSFPPDYPWRGTRTAQYRQVGDAVPPLLAAAVLGELLGVDWRGRLWGLERAS